MLIEFRVTNFRSFRDTQVFSMVAGPLSERDEGQIFDSGLRGFGPFVRSASIYGSNAAGKTNLLRAIKFMKEIVISSAATSSGSQLAPYSPHRFSSETRSAPSEFQMTFAESGVRYEYGFAISEERIENEWLIEYVTGRGRSLFQRKYDKVQKRYDWNFSSYLKGQRLLWSESTRPDALFLSTAIQLNSTQLIPVYKWFQQRLVVVQHPTGLNSGLTYKLLDEPNGKKTLLPFLQEADLGITDVSMKREAIPVGGIIFSGRPEMLLEHVPGQPTPNLVRVKMAHRDANGKEQVELDFADESHGTQTLFLTAGAWLNVFANGEILLYDEIESSLHPLLVQYLIKKFHSDENNKHNAQLIFTTHNTSLLRLLFRRDQVWFVEKDEFGASKLYPLTDFSPRQDEALEQGYLKGRYGALPVLAS